jgi:hypothetical protein
MVLPFAAIIMAPWTRRGVLVVFAAYGLLGHFVPSEPFLTPYLIDVKGFPEDVVRAHRVRDALAD